MWINATFPNSKHAYLNSCKPATPSSVVAACLDTHIPEEVDLILFEVMCSLHLSASDSALASSCSPRSGPSFQPCPSDL